MKNLDNFCIGFSKVLDFSEVLDNFAYNDSSNFDDMVDLYSDAMLIASDCKVAMIKTLALNKIKCYYIVWIMKIKSY